MNTHDSDTRDEALRTRLRPALAEIIDEAAARPATSPIAAPPTFSAASRGASDVGGNVGAPSAGGIGSPSVSAEEGPVRRRVLAFAAVTILVVAGVFAFSRGRGQSVRTGTTTSLGQPAATTTPPSELEPSTGGGTAKVGGLFPDAAFSAGYAVIDPGSVANFNGLRPTTYSNVSRWLAQPLAAFRWMVPADIATSDTPAAPIRWRGPVEPPPDWLIVPNSDPAWASEGDGVTRTVQTSDGTWVEVSLGPEPTTDLDGWLTSLGTLPTATDLVPPDGYVAVPRPDDEIVLRYSVPAVGTTGGGAGSSDSADPATASGAGGEGPWLDLSTVRFDHDLDETQALNWISMYGRAEAVDGFRGSGELYRLIDRGPHADDGSPRSYRWWANPRTLVSINAGGGLTVDQIESFLDGLALSDSVTVEVGPTYNISNDPSLVAAETSDVRAGDFGSYRFVYLQTVPADGSPGCAYLAVGGPNPLATCQAVGARPNTPVCAYAVDSAAAVLGGAYDGYELTLLVDADIADRVSIAHGGGAATNDGSTTRNSPPEASTSSVGVGGPSVVDGSPVRTVDVTGQSGGRSWVAKSARLQTAPTVSGDGVECTRVR